MNDLTQVDTTDATATALVPAAVNPATVFGDAARSVQKAAARAQVADLALLDQRLEVQTLRDAVTAALNGDGDFDAASKAFKAANNKVDKLIDTRDAAVKFALDGITAVRGLLDSMTDQLRILED